MFHGPSVRLAPKRLKRFRSQTLKKPILGDRRKVQEIANRRPGSAIGISINPQARFLSGISVRSVRNAKTSANVTETKVLAPARIAVFRKTAPLPRPAHPARPLRHLP